MSSFTMLTPTMLSMPGVQNQGGFAGSSFGSGFGRILHKMEQELEQMFQELQQDLSDLSSGSPSGNGNPFNGDGGLGGYSDPFSGSRGQGSYQSPWAVTNTGSGQDQIDLGKYTVSLNKADSSWALTDKQTGTTTNVSGDPHVSENGSNWTFKKDLTFQLDDGTRITVHTTPAGDGQTLSSQLDITKDGHGMKVTGLASTDGNQLRVADGLNGYAMDSSNSGLPLLFENGNDWASLGFQNVDSSFADKNL